MTILRNNLAGTPGVTISPANSGAGGNAYDAVNGVSGGGTVAYDDTFTLPGMSSAGKIATAGGAGSLADVRWTTSMGSQAGPVWAELVMLCDGAYPTQDLRIITYNQNGSNCGTAHLLPTGQVNIRDSLGDTIVVSDSLVPLSQFWRMEIFMIGDPAAGQVGFRLYDSPFARSPVEAQVSAPAFNLTGPPNDYDYGPSKTTISSGPLWLGYTALSNEDWLGPVPGGPAGGSDALAVLQLLRRRR